MDSINTKFNYSSYAKKDLIKIIIFTVILWIIMSQIDAFELLIGYTREHESFDLDEIILIVFISCLSAFWYSFRRHLEIKKIQEKILNTNERLNENIKKEVEENRKKDELLAQQSKLAAMGEMMGNIAHQWRQPLNAIGMQNLKMETLMDFNEKITKEEYTPIGKSIEMQLNYMSKTIDDFRDFFVINKSKTNFEIIKCIEKPLNILKPQLTSLHINYCLSGESFIINGLESEFQQVILNIITNAKDSMVEHKIQNKIIKINTKIDNQNGIISIQDNAGGIPENIINRVFEPYYTTKEQGKGTGIGLYISKTIIIDNMKGELSVSNIDDGASFEIKLPIVTQND